MKRQSKATQNTIDDTLQNQSGGGGLGLLRSRRVFFPLFPLTSSYDYFRSSDGAAIEIMIYKQILPVCKYVNEVIKIHNQINTAIYHR